MEQETKLSFVVQKKKKTIYHKADGLALRSNSNWSEWETKTTVCLWLSAVLMLQENTEVTHFPSYLNYLFYIKVISLLL